MILRENNACIFECKGEINKYNDAFVNKDRSNLIFEF